MAQVGAQVLAQAGDNLVPEDLQPVTVNAGPCRVPPRQASRR